MSYPCDQCDQLFDSNFRLYSHKAETHLPTVGIINKNDDENRGSKRPPSSDEPGEQPPCKTPRIEKHGVKRKKPSTFNHSSNSKRRTYQVDVSKSRGNRSIDENDQVRKIIKKGVKRLRGSDDENQHIAPRQKSRRLSPRRFKRSRISDSDSDGGSNGNVNKYRKVESRGTKRIRSLDDASDIAPKKRRRNQPGDDYTIPDVGSTIPDASSAISDASSAMSDAGNTVPDAVSTKIKERKGLIAKLKSDIAKWKRLYEKQSYKVKMNTVELQRKIKVLKDQLEECEEFGETEYDMTKISKSVYNSVTIEEFNKIRTLLANNQIDLLLRGRKNILALQKMASALTYGVIPITNPQRVALSDREKKLVKDIETATVDDVREHIKNNQSVFMKLFSTIDDSLKLVTKTFMKYGLG